MILIILLKFILTECVSVHKFSADSCYRFTTNIFKLSFPIIWNISRISYIPGDKAGLSIQWLWQKASILLSVEKLLMFIYKENSFCPIENLNYYVKVLLIFSMKCIRHLYNYIYIIII